MKDPRVSLRNPLVAALLALLLPGAGHWYQGRRFKATVYSACILTIFVWGMVLGNWQPVYSQLVIQTSEHSPPQLQSSAPELTMSWGYGAQVFVGLPAVPSLIQEMRFRSNGNLPNQLTQPLRSEFRGLLRQFGSDGEQLRQIQGTLELDPANPGGGRNARGQLTTTDADGRPLIYTIDSRIDLGRPVFGSPERTLRCTLVDKETGEEAFADGVVDRPVKDWYQAPRDNLELSRLHGSLSRTYDIASVFTWIAGLLNVLVVWDAFQGPAYGYGDEKPESDKKPAPPEKKS